jgi:hypothetical protein
MLALGSYAWSVEPLDGQQPPLSKAKPGNSAAGSNKKGGAGAKAKQAAAKKRQQPAEPAEDHSPLPARPARQVTKPALTSADLDRLIKAHLVKEAPKVEPAPLTSDVEFVRRVYFDLIGKPPTPEQVRTFVRDRAEQKRPELIERLLKSNDWARNWAKYWRDVVRFHSTNENPARVRFEALADWLANQFHANKPWDEIVTGMITATGRNDENGAVAFPLAYEAQAIEMAGEVSRIFMGVQIQCAQCHDHKTDAWKQRQFHEFAAFFAGARARQVEKPMPGELPVFAVVAQGPRRYTFPDKDMPTKQIPVAPRFFLASTKSTDKSDPAISETVAVSARRALAASYVTGQDNPWFARAFVNRIWYSLMGEAFYEPIDDIGPERTARGAEVLEPLADQWQKGGYDIRWLFRTVMNTQAYQRRVRSTANAAGKTPFASSCPSRLRSDQLFDELAHALAIPLDANGNIVNPRPNGNGQGKAAMKAQFLKAQSAGDSGKAKTAMLSKGELKKVAAATGLSGEAGKKQAVLQRLGGPRLLFDRLFGIDPSVANEEVLGTIPQALYLMNSPLINNRTQARPGLVLGQILNNAADERAALGELYMRVLSRQPTADEVAICGRYIASVGNPREAFEDIFWSLINTTEFLTRR